MDEVLPPLIVEGEVVTRIRLIYYGSDLSLPPPTCITTKPSSEMSRHEDTFTCNLWDAKWKNDKILVT
jgi:hypothetical protein